MKEKLKISAAIQVSGGAAAQLTMSVLEAAKRLGISKNTAYDAVRAGQIPTIKIGRRYLVPCAALDRLLNGDRAA